MRRAARAILIAAAFLLLTLILGLGFADLMMAQRGNLYPSDNERTDQ
tara:strand:- start:416 stop:556 length:141 start_codon:yes stop_codon:yes gene_type:complete